MHFADEEQVNWNGLGLAQTWPEIVLKDTLDNARPVTLFEIFIFCPKKFNFDFPRKIFELFWVKTRKNAIDNFDFTRKILGE